jgi:hypothetical protein
MKKLRLVFILLATLALTACGKSAATDDGSGASATVSETAASTTILKVAGFVSLERGGSLFEAPEGLRLKDLDIVQTGDDSSVWLSLDGEKALQLGPQSALRVDRQGTGLELTLMEGEIVAYTDKLDTGETSTFTGANMAMGVRGGSIELFDGLLTLNSELPQPLMAGFTGWDEFDWENYHYVGEWLDGTPSGEGTVTITRADGTETLTGTLVDGLFEGKTARTVALDNGIILNDELEFVQGRLSSGRQIYGMQPWTNGETP